MSAPEEPTRSGPEEAGAPAGGEPVAPDGAASTPPGFRLFSAGAVAAHAFLFTPALGAALAALNHARLGDRLKARNTLLVGLGATAVLFVLGMVIPERFGSAVTGGFAGATGVLALTLHKEQKPLVEAHLRAGGALAPWWPASILGVSLIAVILAIALGPLLSPGNQAFTRGVAAFEAGRLEDAEQQFRLAVREHPDDDAALYDLALTLARRGRLAEARRFLDRVRDDGEAASKARALRADLDRLAPGP